MVKIQDGSLVPAADIFDGHVEDDEGQSVKFEQVQQGPYPRWEGKTDMNDGSNRVRNFSVSLFDMNLIVRMALTEKSRGGGATATEKTEAAKTEKVTKEVTPSTESKKNSSSDHDLVKKRV